jgi:hypothetical protein
VKVHGKIIKNKRLASRYNGYEELRYPGIDVNGSTVDDVCTTSSYDLSRDTDVVLSKYMHHIGQQDHHYY